MIKNLSEYLIEMLNENVDDVVEESEETIKDEKSFREAARAKFEEVFGDELDEDQMNETITPPPSLGKAVHIQSPNSLCTRSSLLCSIHDPLVRIHLVSYIAHRHSLVAYPTETISPHRYK